MTDAQLARRYTERALQLIRAGNAQAQDVRKELRKLAADLRSLLAGVDVSAISRRSLAGLLRDVDAAISGRYEVITEQQAEAAAEIAAIEAEWSRRASGFNRRAPGLAEIAAGLLIFGVPLAMEWGRNRDGLIIRAGGVIREAAAGQAPPDSVMGRVLGTGPRGREAGGLIQAAARAADTLTHTTVSRAATDGRLAAWRANGVNAFRWWSILDEKTTAGCVLRHGLLYDIETLEPIKHDIPIEHEPPRHWNCRSVLIPSAYDTDIPMPEDGGQSTFREYFASLSEAEQERIFGVGRAELFRDGVITQSDLVSQSGRLLTLGELRAANP